MAISYDYQYSPVGQALGAVTNTASNTFDLTGLTAETQYQVSVRQRNTVNNVIYFSKAATATFTPSNAIKVNLDAITSSLTLPNIGTPIKVNLGVITSALTVNDVRAVIPLNVDSFTLQIKDIEGATTNYVEDVITSDFTFTDLTIGNNYEVKASRYKRVNSVVYPSLFSTAATFEAGAALPIAINLDTITLSNTVNTMTAKIANPLVVNLESISHTTNVIGIVTTVLGSLSTINETVSVNTMGLFQEGVQAYTVRLEHVGFGTTVLTGVLTGYQLTGLVEGDTYRVTVNEEDNADIRNGVTYFRRGSPTVEFVATYRPVIIGDLLAIEPSVSVNQMISIDIGFRVVDFLFSNKRDENFKLNGTTTVPIQSFTASVDGNPMSAAFDGNTFDAELLVALLQISDGDELNQLLNLAINGTTLEVH